MNSDHSQNTLKVLTDLGFTFAFMNENIIRFNEHYSGLNKAIKSHYHELNNSDKKVLKNILVSEGWTRAEVDSYDRLLKGG